MSRAQMSNRVRPRSQCSWMRGTRSCSWVATCCSTGLTLRYSFPEIWRGNATRKSAITRRRGRSLKTSQLQLSDAVQSWSRRGGVSLCSANIDAASPFSSYFPSRMIFGKHTQAVRQHQHHPQDYIIQFTQDRLKIRLG